MGHCARRGCRSAARTPIYDEGRDPDVMRHEMTKIAQPDSEALHKAQTALNALNVAYQYFTPAPWVDERPAVPAVDYLPYNRFA